MPALWRVHAGRASRKTPSSAEELPFANGSFDAVDGNFGMHHFPHPETAIAETFRVLRPGGRIAFTVWASPDKAVALGIEGFIASAVITDEAGEHSEATGALCSFPTEARQFDIEYAKAEIGRCALMRLMG